MLSKLSYHWKDFWFNTKIFPFSIVIKYYTFSYILHRKSLTVRLKKKNLQTYKWRIRCRNRIDRNVIDYVFFKQYHQSTYADIKTTAPIILDLGSNIGLTIADYKIKYPNSIIYGYEMDKENYDLAVENSRKFSNVNLFNKAVWTKKSVITYQNNDISDAYSIDVNYSAKGVQIECLSIPDILVENSIGFVDILKMDIEGAELEIFYNQNLSWLSIIKSFNIEFHHQTEEQMNKHLTLFRNYGFEAKKSLIHWNSIEGINIKLLEDKKFK